MGHFGSKIGLSLFTLDPLEEFFKILHNDSLFSRLCL